MSEYYLLNKNEKLLQFQTLKTLGGAQITAGKPFSEKCRAALGFSDIASWVTDRNYAKHKEHLRKWLAAWELDTVDGFLQITHALGINDCLWVKEINSPLTWEDVNLYQNDFDDITAHTAFDTGLFGLKLSSTSPEFTTEGSFPKCWIREADGIHLYKAGLNGAANLGLEPYSEYMAAGVSAEIFPEKTARYDLKAFKGKIVSTCKLFTDEDTGFIPFYKVLGHFRPNTIADVLSVCRKYGCEREAKEMLLIDSITLNQDRHFGNFGFLMDNDTFKIKGFAPFFDFNLSMLGHAMTEDLRDVEKYLKEYGVGHQIGGRFDEVGAELAKDLKVDLPHTLPVPTHETYRLPEERMELLLPILEKNYAAIRGKTQIYPVTGFSEEEREL